MADEQESSTQSPNHHHHLYMDLASDLSCSMLEFWTNPTQEFFHRRRRDSVSVHCPKQESVSHPKRKGWACARHPTLEFFLQMLGYRMDFVLKSKEMETLVS